MTLTRLMARTLLPFSLVASAGVQPADAHPGRYVDLVDYPDKEANWDRFYALQDHLGAEFHDLCGDTYCEGAYSNHVLLQFRCSVWRATGTVHACALVVGAGNLDVDTPTGRVLPDSRAWVCAAPLGADTPVEMLQAALERRGALLRPLPGSFFSLHDALSNCLN